MNQLKTKFQGIKEFWCMGFGASAGGSILNEMANKMKDCGGEYKEALNLEKLEEVF